MGRHSAPGDADNNDAADNSLDVLVSDRPDSAAMKRTARPTAGRHACAEPDGVGSDTAVTPAIEAAVLEEPVCELPDEAVAPQPLRGLDAVLPGVADPGPAADSEAIGPKRKSGGTRADLRLLRNDRTLVARCVAAVLAPFVLYTLVLVVIAKFSVYLLLIWIPAILAGVLLGSFLDSAHKRART